MKKETKILFVLVVLLTGGLLISGMIAANDPASGKNLKRNHGSMMNSDTGTGNMHEEDDMNEMHKSMHSNNDNGNEKFENDNKKDEIHEETHNQMHSGTRSGGMMDGMISTDRMRRAGNMMG